MKVWFTSDLHIGHLRVAEDRARAANVLGHIKAAADVDMTEDEVLVAWHDRTLANNWDACISRHDLVWVLGDISIGGSQNVRAALEWISARPGRKRLITGNHDGCHPMRRDSHKWQPEYLQAFESVQSAARIRFARQNQIDVLLSHFPYHDDHTETARYGQWRLRDEGELLLHGHTHGSEQVHSYELHIGLDAWDLKPVSQEAVEQHIPAMRAAAKAQRIGPVKERHVRVLERRMRYLERLAAVDEANVHDLKEISALRKTLNALPDADGHPRPANAHDYHQETP